MKRLKEFLKEHISDHQSVWDPIYHSGESSGDPKRMPASAELDLINDIEYVDRKGGGKDDEKARITLRKPEETRSPNLPGKAAPNHIQPNVKSSGHDEYHYPPELEEEEIEITEEGVAAIMKEASEMGTTAILEFEDGEIVEVDSETCAAILSMVSEEEIDEASQSGPALMGLLEMTVDRLNEGYNPASERPTPNADMKKDDWHPLQDNELLMKHTGKGYSNFHNINSEHHGTGSLEDAIRNHTQGTLVHGERGAPGMVFSVRKHPELGGKHSYHITGNDYHEIGFEQ